ncbi:MAG TPA: PAS domain S-box protein, partial [Coleofasciculaceae cyanobacterium]
MEAAFPAHETARLEALYQYKILDTNPEQAFDDFTRLAAQICETPIALMTFIDRDRQWCKSKMGLAITQTAREFSFCAHAILQNQLFIVPNTLADECFASNPFVTDTPYIRFYAGVPLITPQGYALGTLCVLDTVPRELKPQQLEALNILSRQVITQLELRRNLAELEQATQESQQLEHQLSLRQQELLDFLENGTLGLHCLDLNGTILWANRTELERLGYSRPEYVGQPITEFHADSEVIDDILQRLSTQEKLCNYEARLRCKDGSIRYVLIDSDARFIDGKFNHTRCYTRDITEYKRTKEAMRQAT